MAAGRRVAAVGDIVGHATIGPLARQIANVFVLRRRVTQDWLGRGATRGGAAERELSEREDRENT